MTLSPSRPEATVLTCEGRGALAVVRVRGVGALAIVDDLFRPYARPSFADSPPGRLRVGRLRGEAGEEVVAVRRAGASETVEVQCHGGPEAIRTLLGMLAEQGAVIESRETLRRPRPSIREQAWHDLAHAPTLRVAESLLDQYHGALDSAIEAILVRIERDDPDAITDLEALRDRGRIGLRWLSGWRVVIAGRPNVGKSRLLNALAGFERAIVSDRPGTTRDAVSLPLAFDGWPVELIDTAGLRDASDEIERRGVEIAREQQSRADLVLLVLDASEPLTEADISLLSGFPSALRIANKIDLPRRWNTNDRDAIPISARTAEGLDRLSRDIVARLVPNPPPPGAGVPFRREHEGLLKRAMRRMRAGDVPKARRLLRRLLAGPDRTDGNAELRER